MSPKQKREAHAYLKKKNKQVSKRRLCGLLGLEQSTYHYKKQSKPREDEEELIEAMKKFTSKKQKHGRVRVIWHLREVCGFKDNHKRIARLYRQEGLQIGKRPKKKRKSSGLRLVLEKPTKPNQIWAMDFVHDSFCDGRKFRTLTVIDLFTRESPVIEVNRSITGQRVSEVLNSLPVLPEKIVCDNGPEFTSKALDQWAYFKKIELSFIQPGKPNQNAYCESFNARFRDECLNTNWFLNLNDAREEVERWRNEYNTEDPHSSLGMKPPKTFAMEYRNRLTA